MKTKLIALILSFVLASDLFACGEDISLYGKYVGGSSGSTVYNPNNAVFYLIGAASSTTSGQTCSYGGGTGGMYVHGTTFFTENGGGTSTNPATYTYYDATPVYCPSGQTFDTNGQCTICPSPNVVDGNTHLCTSVADYCTQNGGIIKSDGTCLTANNILTSPTSTIGAGLFLNGVFFTALGLIPSPFTPALLSTGLNAIAVGGGMYLYGSATANNLSASSASPSNDLTVGQTRFKIDLNTYTGDTSVTKTDTVSNKVTEVTNVPEKVMQNLANAQPQMVTQAETNQPLPPVDLTGTTDTKYDYTNNTATTTTVNPDQTTTTTTTPITVTNNPDGSTTAAPSTPNSSVPVVNSGGGGQVVNKTPGTAQLGGGVQGGASLDDIYSQLHMGGDPAGTLQGTPDNGLDKANSLMGDVQNSFGSFQMTDPLGLNAVAPSIDTISLDLYGHHYVVFDQNTLNQLPLAMIRLLLLFIAALLGLQNVLTGGI